MDYSGYSGNSQSNTFRNRQQTQKARSSPYNNQIPRERIFVDFFIPPPPPQSSDSENSDFDSTSEDSGYELDLLGKDMNIFELSEKVVNNATNGGKYKKNKNNKVKKISIDNMFNEMRMGDSDSDNQDNFSKQSILRTIRSDSSSQSSLSSTQESTTNIFQENVDSSAEKAEEVLSNKSDLSGINESSIVNQNIDEIVINEKLDKEEKTTEEEKEKEEEKKEEKQEEEEEETVEKEEEQFEKKKEETKSREESPPEREVSTRRHSKARHRSLSPRQPSFMPFDSVISPGHSPRHSPGHSPSPHYSFSPHSGSDSYSDNYRHGVTTREKSITERIMSPFPLDDEMLSKPSERTSREVSPVKGTSELENVLNAYPETKKSHVLTPFVRSPSPVSSPRQLDDSDEMNNKDDKDNKDNKDNKDGKGESCEISIECEEEISPKLEEKEEKVNVNINASPDHNQQDEFNSNQPSEHMQSKESNEIKDSLNSQTNIHYTPLPNADSEDGMVPTIHTEMTVQKESPASPSSNRLSRVINAQNLPSPVDGNTRKRTGSLFFPYIAESELLNIQKEVAFDYLSSEEEGEGEREGERKLRRVGRFWKSSILIDVLGVYYSIINRNNESLSKVLNRRIMKKLFLQ